MSLRSLAGLSVAVLVVTAFAVPRILSGAREVEAEPSAPAPAPALPVQVVEVRPQRLVERLSTTGTLRANEQIELASEIAGVVRKIEFHEGSHVEKGDLLVQINDEELQAQRERVQYQLKLAEQREQRQRELREQGVTSEADYDIASNELNVLKASLRLVDAQLAKTKIRAPFSGVIGLRYVSEGSLLSPQTKIATLQDLDSIKLDFSLPEKYAGRVGPGDGVRFRVKGSDKDYTARIYAVEPRVDPETRSLVIRARTANTGRVLMPGAFADVRLAVGEVHDALAVPSLAVIPELGGKKVFVVENGAAQPRSVQTGIRTDTEVQITSGLQPGDRVIVSSIQQLRADLPVDPSPAGGEAGAAP